MKISYDSILNLLNKNYSVISKDKKNYFINDKGEIVASYNKNSISMFFDFPAESREIWNHEGRVVLTFAKDFQVNSYVADVLFLEGLCGATNDTEVIENYAYFTVNNHELYNINGDNKLQEKFDSLPYEERIKILEEITGASFKGAKIDGIRLFKPEKETTYGSCGFIYSKNGIADITILDEIYIHNIKVCDIVDHLNFVVNVINVKEINEDFDFDRVYEFWRKKNDWYYNSDEQDLTKWTERRKDSTIDESEINIVGNPYKCLLDPIYYNSKGSINTRKLKMKAILSRIAPNSKIPSILDSYDFNLRSVDVKKQLKKIK